MLFLRTQKQLRLEHSPVLVYKDCEVLRLLINVAGNFQQDEYSDAIGNHAGQTNQRVNSICSHGAEDELILNATNSSGLYNGSMKEGTQKNVLL